MSRVAKTDESYELCENILIRPVQHLYLTNTLPSVNIQAVRNSAKNFGKICARFLAAKAF